MERQGYILLDRNIRDHKIWRKKPFSPGQAWVDLLFRAAYKKHKVMFNDNLLELERGQLVTSLRKLGSDWGWSTKKVSRWLKLWAESGSLQSKPWTITDPKVTPKVTPKVKPQRKRSGTLITICEYERYQNPVRGEETPKETPRKRRGNAEETRENTSNAVNTVNAVTKWAPTHDYLTDWNVWVDGLEHPVSQHVMRKLTSKRRQKIKTREAEGFAEAWPKILSEMVKGRNYLGTSATWFSFDWLIKNDDNWTKVAEGKYRDRPRAERTEDLSYAEMVGRKTG